MKRLPQVVIFLSFLLLQAWLTPKTFAIEDPNSVPNNKIGIHILFANELDAAAQFVNTNGGDWGYVTIPIQIGDRDLDKWQAFMDNARKNHIIPLMRLASQGGYFDTSVWEKPTAADVVDFANFLDSLNWPTKNRYVIIFNEPNRGDEWSGKANPQEYADLLSFAVTVFKSKSQNFFLISAGMDNAAPQKAPQYMNEYSYLRAMNDAVPGIFEQIDGFASHSYPNPGFAQPPGVNSTESISSFLYERDLIQTMRHRNIPIFITETGWNTATLSDTTKADYYQKAFETIWSDPDIVAITPFLLNAGAGSFSGFSFLAPNGDITPQYIVIRNMKKVAGKPLLEPYILGTEKEASSQLPERDYTKVPPTDHSPFSLSTMAQTTFKWMLRL